MQPTACPHINELLDSLLSQMKTILGDKLVGLYLYGSLVTGDFDIDISDIDLLAATSSDNDETEFDALKQMQDGFVATHPNGRRLEIAYVVMR
jgi:predicted nucleotidyltransferase